MTVFDRSVNIMTGVDRSVKTFANKNCEITVAAAVIKMNTLTKKDVVTENETKVSEPDAREKIFRAAEELFIERGHDGVSVNDIAEKAGVAKALVFYYFESKKNLFGLKHFDFLSFLAQYLHQFLSFWGNKITKNRNLQRTCKTAGQFRIL